MGEGERVGIFRSFDFSNQSQAPFWIAINEDVKI
jgi:hypothetical protein